MKENPEPVYPHLLSISRRCDVPAFHGEWLCRVLERGEVPVPNPYSGKSRRVSFASVLAAVLWTKNPEPFFSLLDRFSGFIPRFYVHYTLNDYSQTGLEPGLPPLQKRIDSFKRLADRLGAGRVVWRFDPLCLAAGISLDTLLERVSLLAERLAGYTDELVFSFYKPDEYSRVRRNMDHAGVSVRPFSSNEVFKAARALGEIAACRGMHAVSCAETADLEAAGISPSRCIDDRRFVRLYPGYRELMLHLGRVAGPERLFPETGEETYKRLKDRHQRRGCGCIRSVDIGTYNSCPHGCLYCYANRSPQGGWGNPEG